MKLFKLVLASSLLASFIGLSGCYEERTTPIVLIRKGVPLSAQQEVPTNPSTATGTMDLEYSRASRILTYTLKWSGLTGPVAAGHIHGTAQQGFNAGVLHTLQGIPNPTLFGTSGTLSGSVIMDGYVMREEDLLGGRYYFNIHTAANPGGEIRGQILVQ